MIDVEKYEPESIRPTLQKLVRDRFLRLDLTYMRKRLRKDRVRSLS